MGNFANPFQENPNPNRKITNEELIQAIRLDIAGELEAIFRYDAHFLATDDPAARKILADIRDEEKAHVGELMTLLKILDPREAKFFADGEAEVQELLESMGSGDFTPKPVEVAAKIQKTVGSLAEEQND